MTPTTKQRLPEIFIYTVLWLAVFMASPIGLYMKMSGSTPSAFPWTEVWKMWKDILPFFLLFLLHNFCLLPRLLLRRKTALYVLCLTGALLLCWFAWKDDHPAREKRFGPPSREERQGPSRPMPGKDDFAAFPGDFPPSAPGEMGMPAPDGREDRPEMRPDAPEREDFSGQAEGPFRDKRPGMFPEPKMPFLFPGKDAIRFIIALLMLGFNIGIRLLFKSQRDAEALKELESRSLRQQLDYLKYQISPHFFMNTLNNIHALIDIDTEKAKYTVLELSRLMRYLLYESEKGLIDLRKEIEFLSNYLALMRLRYTDQVKITTDLPGEVPDIRIPPLLFISFVENAFKHGISYQETSFVCLSLRVDEERIYFHCINSNRPDQHSPEKGIGLENTQKRLRLLYGNRYHLQMGEHAGTFSISLEIPIKI